LDSLGFVYHHLQDHASAIAHYEQALSMYEKAGDRFELAAALDRLGNTHQSVPDVKTAQDCWEKALAILDDLGNPDAAQIRAKLRLLGG
jgi:tetratricopeptide (TPR) repeat protein